MNVEYYSQADGSQYVEVSVVTGDVAVVSGLLPGEPIFVLRARDAAALPGVQIWLQMAQGNLPESRIAGLNADIAAMARWRRANAQWVRDAD